MSILSSRPALRWLVPVAITVVAIGGGAALKTLAASADLHLADRSAAQLLVDLQTAKLDGMSGTVQQSADLGLPALPIPTGQGSSQLSSLISGSHTLRVWYAGPDKARIALLGTLGESDIIRNGRDVWTWDSKANKATHRVLPAEDTSKDPATKKPATPDASALPRTPQEAADLALNAIDPTTVVRTGNAARVAGQAAYELILSPRDTTSLIGEVRLAIDATHHVPLRVQVFARSGGKPAFEVAFTKISFARPDDAQFKFNPPPNATVQESTETPAPDKRTAAPNGKPAGPTAQPDAQPKVVGTGWTSVLVATMPQSKPPASAGPNTPNAPNTPGADGRDTSIAGLLGRLPQVSGTWGTGRMLSGKLFSVLITDDGRVLAGAVTPQRLFEVAGG
jgi:outer membrane lipoprotein-sorting protein